MIHFVTHEFAPFRGGIATYVRETAHAAADLGFPVRVLAPDYGRSHELVDAALDFPIDRLGGNGRLTPAGIWSLARGLAARRESLRESKLILLSPGALMAAMIAHELGWLPQGTSLVSFFHGSEVLRFHRHPIWRLLAARFLSRTRPACASHFVAGLIHEKRLFPSDVTILRAPCACPSHIISTVASLDITSCRPNSSDDFEILTVARLHPRKGQHLTAEALGLLPPDLKRRVHYVVAGEGSADYRNQIARACESAGIRHTFREVAAPDELPSIYSACDAFVMTSVQLPESVEGFGISYLEASAHGKPIVAFRTGGVEEAVIADRTGLLVAEGDLSGVASAVRRLMVEPDLRQRLGQGGRDFALSLSWKPAARTLCEA